MTHPRTSGTLAVLLAVLVCAGCAPEPGRDIAGNSVASATTLPPGARRDCKLGQPVDKCPIVTDVPVITTVAGPPPAETAEATEGVTQFKLGDVAEVTQGDGEATGTITISDPKTYTKPKAAYGEKPKNGRFVSMTILAVGTSGVFSVNPFDFYLTDGDGNRFEYGDGNVFMESGDKGLNGVDLNPGEKVKATLLFDASPKARTLAYAPSLGSQTLGTWSLD